MSALDASVTLDDVFSVVVAKRVPLAPELAGYLVLEIAEHADPNGGDVDPKSVFVGEEGTVALVKPKRDGATGDAEASIRAALARLLEASGSQTPALAAASKRRSGTGLPGLAEELEAALIPVNRAAGRRALARLAREVKRVTLGVGRNALPSTSDAAPPSRRASSPAHQVPSAPPPPVAPSAPAPPVAQSATPPPAGPTAPSAPFAMAPSAPPPSSGRTPPPAVVVPGATPPPALTRSAPPPPATFSPHEEPTTARGQIPDEVMKKATPEPLDASEMPTTQFEPMGRTPSPSQADVDSLIAQFGVSGASEQQHARNLKAMVGLDPTPPPPEIARRIETREIAVGGGESDVESLLAMGADASPASSARASARAATPAPSPAARGPRASMASSPGHNVDERQMPTQPSSVKKMRASTPSMSQMKKGRGSWVVLVLAVVIVAAGAYAVWQLRPEAGAGRGPAAPPASATAAPPPAATSCKATLVVTDVPPHAEVLLGKGQAPAEVELMPVGARLEFVATAEGYAPKRTVVPAGARWDNGPDGKPRFEVAVQLDKSKARPGTNDPWPAGEPGSEVGGQGPPGTVRVVATPRGAEVWMLAGIGPDARVEQLPCGRDVEVLVAGPTTYRKRLHVAAADFVVEETPGMPPPKVPVRTARVSGK